MKFPHVNSPDDGSPLPSTANHFYTLPITSNPVLRSLSSLLVGTPETTRFRALELRQVHNQKQQRNGRKSRTTATGIQVGHHGFQTAGDGSNVNPLL